MAVLLSLPVIVLVGRRFVRVGKRWDVVASLVALLYAALVLPAATESDSLLWALAVLAGAASLPFFTILVLRVVSTLGLHWAERRLSEVGQEDPAAEARAQGLVQVARRFDDWW